MALYPGVNGVGEVVVEQGRVTQDHGRAATGDRRARNLLNIGPGPRTSSRSGRGWGADSEFESPADHQVQINITLTLCSVFQRF